MVTEACKLPCFGGFAVTLEYGISRLTSDIDVLDVAPPRMVATLMKEGGKGSPLAIKHKVFWMSWASRMRRMTTNRASAPCTQEHFNIFI